MNQRPVALALAVAALLVPLTGCGGDDTGPDGGAGGHRGIDARAYYDDYPEPEVLYDMAAPSAAPPGGSSALEGSGAPEVPDLPTVPDPDEDNTFVDEGTQGFTDTRSDPRSTFALDVDTGSFGVARTLLRDGYPVPPSSVRPEEWINALPYGDPAPTDADLAVTTETGPAPTLDARSALVRVAVVAREVAPAERPRVNVTLVVDRSGSMDIRERLGLVKASLAVLADELRDDDTVSLVSFENEAKPILEPTPISHTKQILDAIDRLTPGGSTNLAAGLRLGYRQAREAFDEDGVNLVVLCSDGVANVGPTGPGSITDLIARQGAEGIHLVTVGFGMGNYNDHLMEQLADLGDGFYSYVDDFDEAERLFGTDLTTTLVPVAEEARAQVSFDPDLVSAYRLIGYENRDLADRDFTDLSVDAGELGSGHRASALYEVRLTAAGRALAEGAPLGTAAVVWRSPALEGGDAQRAEAPVLARPVQIDMVGEGPDAAEAALPSASFRLAALTADVAQWFKQAEPFVDRGVTLGDLRERADALVAEGVAGADRVAELLDAVRGVPTGE